MSKEKRAFYAAIVLLAALVGYQFYIGNRREKIRGSATRFVAEQSVRGAALSPYAGKLTPNHLLWYGPPGRPKDWVCHKVRYPATPGQEIERLMMGAPMGSPATGSPVLKSWAFCPPSEEDM